MRNYTLTSFCLLVIVLLGCGGVAEPVSDIGQAGSAGNEGDSGQPDAGPKKAYWVELSGTPPEARDLHSAVWTGKQMIVWGGRLWNQSTKKYSYLNSGGIYDLGKDDWLFMSNTQAPAARILNSAVWSGSKMVIWSGINQGGVLEDGAAFDPATNEWQVISKQNAPVARYMHATAWTGTKMIVTGGLAADSKPTKSGGIYDPATDTWYLIADAPEPCSEQAVLWTGSLMLSFGGYNGETESYCGNYAYDPATNAWSTLPATNVPQARTGSSAVWTGNRALMWGGYLKTEPLEPLANGGIYDPSDAWKNMETAKSPFARFSQTAVWSGKRMIVWGGHLEITGTDSGGEYDPATDKWIEINGIAPPNRTFHTAVWTGTGMIVWGGFNGIEDINNGGIYYPAE